MKRKVIQIADSTQLVSLPRKWCLENGIKKGDELELEVEPNKINITTDRNQDIHRVEINSEPLGEFLTRFIHGLYMHGVDEIKVNIKGSKDLERIQKTLRKDVGFEVVEQGPRHCVIKNISGDIESFDQLLRRILILMLNMTDEGLNCIKENNIKELAHLITLEEANNRFTISCRRFLNRKGHPTYKVGPLYFIVEELEKLADEYKYFYRYLVQSGISEPARKGLINDFTKINKSLRNITECVYKFDPEKLVKIHETKQEMFKKWDDFVATKKPNQEQLILTHHLAVISQKIANFCGLLVAMQEPA